MIKTFFCSVCHSTKPAATTTGGTGYGTKENGEKICYACYAIEDIRYMNDNGRMTLYYDGRKISNWPGTLEFHATRYKEGKHNIARKRIDVWFIGPSNDLWHGVQYGSNTQILHCKKIKKVHRTRRLNPHDSI